MTPRSPRSSSPRTRTTPKKTTPQTTPQARAAPQTSSPRTKSTVLRNKSIVSSTLDVSLSLHSGSTAYTDGLSSTRATLGADTVSRKTFSTNSDGSLHPRSFCDEMSCCKSYLGKNNEVKMTSNLPECFFRCVLMSLFLVCYMCVGAAIFCEIEREQEKEHSRRMKELWKEFQEENKIPEDQMGRFLMKHYEMCEMGDHNHEANNVQWDYISSLFFTGTILTTIGYGHSSPSTLGGRIFTIFYASLGIPFMLGLLNVVAEILLTTLKILKSKIKKKPYPDVFHSEVFASALFCVFVLLVFMTFIFKMQESSWTYEQSIYFSFITMTTIGFGDFVPAQVDVMNDSPTLITREFFNLLLIFISVLVWYFLSQVSAQVLKVHLKALHKRVKVSRMFSKNQTNKYPQLEQNHQTVEVDSDDAEMTGGRDHCTCNCTCGYDHDHMTDSASAILDSHSAVSDRSVLEPQYPGNNNLECIKDDDDGELDSDNEDQCSESSIHSSASEPTSRNPPEFPPLFDQGAEPPDPLKIPSIVITPVIVNTTLPGGTQTSPTYSTLLNSETREHPYDSGKGSSEITNYTCQTNNFSTTKSASQSSSSLSTNSSGVFSDLHSKGGVYENGGPRKARSKSEIVEMSPGCSSWQLGSKSIRRISRSLTDLDFSNRPCRYKCLSEGKLNSIGCEEDTNRKEESFSIHTKVFDDMMKP